MFISIHIMKTILLATALHLHYNTKPIVLINKLFGVFLWVLMIQNLTLYPVWLVSLEKYYYVYYAAPFLLFYGPFLFFYFEASEFEKLSRKKLFLHLLPVLIVWIAFLSIVLNLKSIEQISTYYYVILYSCVAISLSVYSIYIFLIQRKTVYSAKIIYCAWYCILFGVFIFLMVIQLLHSNQYERIIYENNKIILNLFLMFGVLFVFTEAFQRFKFKFEVNKKAAAPKVPIYPKISTSPSIQGNTSPRIKMMDGSQVLDEFFSSEAIRSVDLTLKKAASQLSITQKKLSEMIFASYGTSFAKLLVKKRIEYACLLLLSPEFDESYDKLPAMCGFKSAASFYRNFRSMMHSTPSKFRHRYLDTVHQKNYMQTR